MVAPDRTRGLDVRFGSSYVNTVWTGGGTMRSFEGSAKSGAKFGDRRGRLGIRPPLDTASY
jgi:hypothetical protein